MIGKQLDGQAGLRFPRLFQDRPSEFVVVVDRRRHLQEGRVFAPPI